MPLETEPATWMRTWENALRVAQTYADLFRGQRFRVTREREPYSREWAWAVREAPEVVAEPCS